MSLGWLEGINQTGIRPGRGVWRGGLGRPHSHTLNAAETESAGVEQVARRHSSGRGMVAWKKRYRWRCRCEEGRPRYAWSGGKGFIVKGMEGIKGGTRSRKNTA